MTAGLNLASRPFRNERLPTLLVLLGAAALAALSVEHAVVLRGLLPGGSSALHQEVARLEQERSRLRAERQELRAPAPGRATLAQWTRIKDLVDRRTLSWTALLSLLEEVMPPDVRLVAVSPAGTGTVPVLEVTAVARSKQAALGFVGLMERRPEFSNIYPESLTEVADGSELRCSMRYHPAQPAPAGPTDEPATAAPGEGPGPERGHPTGDGAGEVP